MVTNDQKKCLENSEKKREGEVDVAVGIGTGIGVGNCTIGYGEQYTLEVASSIFQKKKKTEKKDTEKG